MAGVVVFFVVVEVVFSVVVDFNIGSSSNKLKSSKNGRESSVVDDSLDDVVDSDEDSADVVEFMSWSIAYQVNS